MKAKHRRHDTAFKARVGLEALKGQKTTQQIAAEYDVHPTQVPEWKKTLSEGLGEAFERGKGGLGEEFEREREKLHSKIGATCLYFFLRQHNGMTMGLGNPPMLPIAAMVLRIAMFLVTIILLPCLGPVGRAGFVRYTLSAGLLWGCFIISTNVTNVALGAGLCWKAYFAAGFAAYLLGAFVCFLRWRRASGMKYFAWILAALALGFTSCLHASEELVGVSIRYLQIEGESHYGLYLYRVNGELIRRLTHPTDSQDTKPNFSADGKTLYFTRSRLKESVPCAIGIGGKDFRQLQGEEADRYRTTSASPSFGYDDYDFSNKEPAPVYPLRYPAPDGCVEVVYEKFDVPKDANEDYYDTQARHAFLVDLRTGSRTALSSLPGCEGVGNPLKLSAPSLAVFVLAPPLRAAFLDRHLNSTDGTAVFGLDLERRRLVRLGPNWVTVVPLPEAAAFYTVTQERYQPLGDGRTVNCSYLERWNADFKKVRFAAPKVALCGGASVYRQGKPSLNIFPEN